MWQVIMTVLILFLIIELYIPQSAYLWGTSFDKHTTYQGRGMKVRKISKENKEASENNKTET